MGSHDKGTPGHIHPAIKGNQYSSFPIQASACFCVVVLSVNTLGVLLYHIYTTPEFIAFALISHKCLTINVTIAFYLPNPPNSPYFSPYLPLGIQLAIYTKALYLSLAFHQLENFETVHVFVL